MIEKPTFNDLYKQELWEMLAYTTFASEKPYRRNRVDMSVVKHSLSYALTSYSITSKVLVQFINDVGVAPPAEWTQKLQDWLNEEHAKEIEHLREVRDA